MNLLDMLRYGDPGTSPPIQTIVLSLLLAFVIGQVIGWTYMLTHTTPSYSSSFVASLVVLACDCCVDDDPADRQPGDRFWVAGCVCRRTVSQCFERHARHNVYHVGDCGRHGDGHLPLLHGSDRRGCVLLVLLYLWLTEFGVRHRFDAAVVGLRTLGFWHRRAKRSSRSCCAFPIEFYLTSERLSFDARQVLSYRLLLRDPARRGELRDGLATVGDVQELSFYLQDDESEL